MINIEKKAIDDFFTEYKALSEKETNQIKKLIEQDNLTWKDLKGKFKYEVYKNKVIKEQLKKDFNSKCAYCESIFLHNSYGEVEHWRPKKKVTEYSDHKGYYWLGSDWANLLWACRICNSTLYKGNRFPHQPGSIVAYKSSDSLENETPLLLNPIDKSKNFESIFDYNFNGWISTTNLLGRNSIIVYGLNRINLVAERKKIAQEIDRSFRLLAHFEENLLFYIEIEPTLNGNLKVKCKEKIERVKNQIDEVISFLNTVVKSDYAFAGMNRKLFKKKLEEFKESTLKKILEDKVKWD